MKKMIMLLTILASFSAFADMAIDIKANENLHLQGLSFYKATTLLKGCKTLVLSGGRIKPLPIEMMKNVSPKITAHNQRFEYIESINNACSFGLERAFVVVNHAKINEDFKNIEVAVSAVDLNDRVQKIIYKKHGDTYVNQVNSILVGPNGLAKVEIVLEE